MAFILDLLALPVLGPAKLVGWLAATVAEHAERESLDAGRVRGELLELQQIYEAGAIDETAYDRQERDLLERLSAIRESKRARAGLNDAA